ncbi:dCTP deaminase [Candidatus Nomurabacteria bacterium]|uniref:dCTP deaminase, dUMP-forming n=1 Tax=Candidatus Dojkabacteria bacterium TaxID=2099670 RepID=A0A955KWI3_9BACT|nr:dCTP deaminase [Candidatus Dojkabacteria bacterium]MCB9789815.1 dCTP deaminase [Candidatus Nomurabacteria bacterium]MCB9803561.1 dCTP deaminase [Candidatus Nomurabacteria bacterium]
MILSDRTIKEKLKSGEIAIEPFTPENLQPASYDLTLGTKALVFDITNHTEIDVKKPTEDLMRELDINQFGSLVVHPGEFVLSNVAEIVGVDASHVARLEGKSSLGRLGLIVHATAGFLDPGNKLRMTLEISNIGALPVRLYPGMKIAQIAFEQLDQPSEKPYGSKELNSKYLGDMTVKASQIHKNF